MASASAAPKIVLVGKKTDGFNADPDSPEYEGSLRGCEKIIDGTIKEEFKKRRDSDTCHFSIPRDNAKGEELGLLEHFSNERVRKDLANRYTNAGWYARFVFVDADKTYRLELN